MANEKNTRISESELNARYTAAAYKFAQVSGWRDYLALAEEFRALDTYKDSARKYDQCVKAASAPAYREITDTIRTKGLETTAEEYREAARIMQIIQDYQDAREVMRVYTIKANALTYEAAMALLSNSDATTEELGEGVAMLKTIKGFKNTRELIERFEKYYFDRMYNEALTLMQKGHVFSEFEVTVEPLYETLGTPASSHALGAPIESACCEIRTQPRLMRFFAALFSAVSSYQLPVKVTSIVTVAANMTTAPVYHDSILQHLMAR